MELRNEQKRQNGMKKLAQNWHDLERICMKSQKIYVYHIEHISGLGNDSEQGQMALCKLLTFTCGHRFNHIIYTNNTNMGCELQKEMGQSVALETEVITTLTSYLNQLL